ncbi:MAG: hypothetical protein AB1921_19995 [Thermodesulfobacteriota bacterium]
MHTILVTVLAITALILVVTVVVTVIIFRVMAGRSRDAVAAISQKTGEKPALRLSTLAARMAGKMDGVPFQCEYTPPIKQAPPMFAVTLPGKASWAATVRLKNGWDRFCEKISLARPIRSGDPGFDSRFFVDTADVRALSAALSSADTRMAVAACFDVGIKRLKINPDGVTLVRVLGREQKPEYSDLQNLLALAGPVAAAARRSPVGTAPEGLSERSLGFVLAVPLAIAIVGGTIGLAVGLNVYRPLFPSFFPMLDIGLPYAIAGFLGYAAFAWALTRPRTNRHVFLPVALFCGILAAGLGVSGPVYFINGFYDASPAREIAATVERNCTGGKGAKTVVFNVEGTESAALPRPRSCCRVGEPVRIVVKKGRMDITWVASWKTTKE